jgi:phage-related protein
MFKRSTQYELVTAVSAPSADGNKAEINPIIKITEINSGK